jgi:hypothetical protein
MTYDIMPILCGMRQCSDAAVRVVRRTVTVVFDESSLTGSERGAVGGWVLVTWFDFQMHF